jgi:hypothetical protein
MMKTTMQSTPAPAGAVQLELGLAGQDPVYVLPPPERKVARAQWWFGQMRRAVQEALDWRTPPPGRAEQTWLPAEVR